MNIVKALKPLVSRSPFFASLYRNLRDERALRKQPTNTTLGFRFNGNLAMEKGEFEPIETLLISKLLAQTSVLINVGANIGYYCCLALAQKKRVVAFEPIPTNQRYLYRNVFVNGWGNSFECYPIALSDHIGLIEIFGAGTGASLVKGWAGQNFSTIVPVSTLDTVLGDRFIYDEPLIIVDIEGAEHAMLKGASKLLGAQKKPIWFVEISVAEHQPEGIEVNPYLLRTFELFEDKGYTALTADKNPRVITLDEISKIEVSKVDTLSAHNFIFVDNARIDTILATL